MKKLFLLSALCASVLCSCSKDDEIDSKDSFGKAEILFELQGPDYQGVPASDILEYYSFTVYGSNFEGNRIVEKDLCSGRHDTVITCTIAPTADHSLFANLGLRVEQKKDIPDGMYSIDHSVHVTYAIYDKSGKKLNSGFIVQNTTNGEVQKDWFKSQIEDNSFSGKFELCYVQRFMSDEWMYNIAYSRNAPN